MMFAVLVIVASVERRRKPALPPNSVFSVNTTILDNTPGLIVTNITTNGVEYLNVKYVNTTIRQRTAIDIGLFTIPAGCYPCVGDLWCANQLHPVGCWSDDACTFTDGVEGCEDMFPSGEEKVEQCEECHAQGEDYCLMQNICVEVASKSCLYKADHITIDEEFSATKGISMDCNDASELYYTYTSTNGTSNSNYIIIITGGSIVFVFLILCGVCCCKSEASVTPYDKTEDFTADKVTTRGEGKQL